MQTASDRTAEICCHVQGGAWLRFLMFLQDVAHDSRLW